MDTITLRYDIMSGGGDIVDTITLRYDIWSGWGDIMGTITLRYDIGSGPLTSWTQSLSGTK